MTDRSSEERSRSNEETPKWVQTVASIRGELMTRFSDRLSMEEIASCAYAVAALEDRQEAAPRELGRIACHVAPDREAIARNAAKEPEGERIRAELEDFLTRNKIVTMRLDTEEHCVSVDIAKLPPEIKPVLRLWGSIYVRNESRGVPSEATPSKENAPPERERFMRGGQEYWIKTAPAPEVQGTPAKEKNDCLMCDEDEICQHDPELKDALRGQVGKAIANVSARAPVGTPQKETSPKQCTWVDRMDFTGGIQCNFQRGHKGRHSFEKTAPVPEGVQGKEPQTPTAQELAKGYCTDMIATLQANVREGKETLNKCPRCSLNQRTFCLACVNQLIATAKTSGEAAGRRSAITELKQSAQSLIAARTAWLEQHGVPISMEFVRFANAIGDLTDLIAECAELQEKTK